MDISKEYILMCQKTEEIQSLILKQQSNDSIVYCPHCNQTFDLEFDGFMWLENYGDGDKCQQFVSYYHTSDNSTFHGKIAIWLPRQDQLQEMIERNNAYCLADDFVKWITEETRDNPMSSLFRLRFSMEQLWLAFVMFEKYGKIFNGNDWIKK